MDRADSSQFLADTTTETPPLAQGESRVHELVAQQAVSTPDALAVSDGQHALSYAELDSRANRLANYLQSLGVNRDAAVGLYLERSASLVVAALAILKAGGAYVPLDPVCPPERVAYMLQDSGAGIVVTESRFMPRLASGAWTMVALDGDAEKIDRQSEIPPDSAVKPEDLAYIIYTSGSTGQPKGVEIVHGGLSNLVSWHQEAFRVTPADRASVQAALGFDASVWEMWPYLTAGASLHVAKDQIRNDASALRDWIAGQRITICFAPTAMAESMLALEWPASTSLRFLLTGADTLKKYPSAQLPFVLVNNYGPTECTVVTTSGVVPPAGFVAGLPSIGRPIKGTEVYILDDRSQPVEEGMAGEIYIGGAGLARGYRNRPEMTADRFVSNPFSSEPGARLYRTGDRARWTPDRQIAFMGRLDDQVKLRGYRIEPNEIATVLGQYPGTRSTAVVARDNELGEKELVAYVVVAAGSTVSAAALREYLKQRLPEYMVPTSFVQLENMPITANGKVDRAALPNPNGTKLRDEAFAEPRTQVEQRLVRILAPLLKMDRISVNDNFFLLGGHSLLGTQLIARVSETFGVDLTLLKLFDHPTVAEMSAEIEDLILAKVENMSKAELTGDHSRSVA